MADREPETDVRGVPSPLPLMNGQTTARFLGWFSVGLGLAEVVAPNAITRALGTRRRPGLVRTAYGLRELAVGAGLLTTRTPQPWVWARVAGDVLDLATLGAALGGRRSNRGAVGFALASVAAVTALDVRTALALGTENGTSGATEKGAPPDAEEVRSSITIGRPPEEVYWAWRDPVTVATMLQPFARVHAESPELAHIQPRTPLGGALQWSWDVPDERPGEFMRFRSLEGSTVRNEGTATLRPTADGRGTHLEVHARYQAPGGPLGTKALAAFGLVPQKALDETLDRFRDLVESGRTPTRPEERSAGARTDLP